LYICYVDESGNTGNNLKDIHQPYLVLTALLVPPKNISEIEQDVRNLGIKYFGVDAQNTDFEFHGYDIYNGRGKYFEKLSFEKRINIFDEIVEIVIKHKCIHIGYVSINKLNYNVDIHIQQMAFNCLLEKLEEKLNGILNSYCLLVLDEQDEIEQDLIDDLDTYKALSKSKIIDSVHFVQSKNNYLIQLTDVMCYLIRKGEDTKKKLVIDHSNSKSSLNLNKWVENYGHKGKVYFSKIYDKINKEKSWLFKSYTNSGN